MNLRHLSSIAFLSFALCNPSWSQTSQAAPEPSAASKAYNEAMNGMHKDMMKGISNADPDIAFAAGMIPHHEGAIAMARIQLEYGKDPELRQLAQNVIEAQNAEIAFMRAWLVRNAPATPNDTPVDAHAHH